MPSNLTNYVKLLRQQGKTIQDIRQNDYPSGDHRQYDDYGDSQKSSFRRLTTENISLVTKRLKWKGF